MAWGTPAHAAEAKFPARPVRVVVPSTPGGALDILSRLLAQKLPDRWGQQLIVDNRSGAGGVIGSDIVAKANADGYTFLVVALGYAANPALYRDLPYRTPDDFSPITLIATAPNVLVVPPAVAARDLKEFIALAARGGTPLVYGSSGVGTSGHLAVELLKNMAKIELTHVPYKGAGASTAAIVAGQVQLLSTALGAAYLHIRSGRLRALAVTGERRAAVAPDVPTAAESGLPGYVVDGWFAALAPARTPPRIVQQLQSDIAATLALPDISEKLAAIGFEAGGMSPRETDRFLRAEMAKWGRLIRETGIKGN
jgi:tripartite-type tricarboxylate transporter receptor subunit TctC